MIARNVSSEGCDNTRHIRTVAPICGSYSRWSGCEQVYSLGVSKNTKVPAYPAETSLFTPIAIETSGVWNSEASEFIEEREKRIIAVTGDIRENSHIFQQISVAIQRGNMRSFAGSFTTEDE